MKRTSSAIATIAAGALLAACGSSSSSSNAGTSGAATGNSGASAQSVIVWRRHVNGICRVHLRAVQGLPRPTSATAAALSTYLTGLIAAGTNEATQIQAVKAPPRFATGQAQMVKDLQTLNNALQQVNNKHLAGAAWEQALVGATQSPALQQARQDFIAQSRAAGLRECLASNVRSP